jgi:5-methylcytosine-specific restriction endonuclease McrA
MLRRSGEKRDAFAKRRTCGPGCLKAYMAEVQRAYWDSQPPGKSKGALCRRARKHLKAACEKCGTTDQLEAHHRDEDRSNFAAENIETLCKPCHLRHHWPA